MLIIFPHSQASLTCLEFLSPRSMPWGNREVTAWAKLADLSEVPSISSPWLIIRVTQDHWTFLQKKRQKQTNKNHILNLVLFNTKTHTVSTRCRRALLVAWTSYCLCPGTMCVGIWREQLQGWGWPRTCMERQESPVFKLWQVLQEWRPTYPWKNLRNGMGRSLCFLLVLSEMRGRGWR